MSSLDRLPPHLPAPTCNIEQHARHERLKFFLIAAFFGVLGGMSGAAMILGWIWPGFAGGDSWGFAAYHVASFNPLDGRVAEDSQDRLVSVYAAASTITDVRYFTAKDKVGTAAILSTDGWVVMYLPTFDGTTKNWQILDADGKVSSVSTALFDRVSGLVYLKIADQDRVVAFADPPVIGDDVFVQENGAWSQASIENVATALSTGSHLDAAPTSGYSLSRTFSVGAPAFSRQGKLIGFVVGGNTVLPATSFAPIVTSVLSGQGIRYRSLGIEGWFNEEQPIVVGGERKQGFLVNKISSKTSPFKRGDVVIAINNQIVTQSILWHTITVSDTYSVTVVRSGKKVSFTVSPQLIVNP